MFLLTYLLTYMGLAEWRQKEMAVINETLAGAERKVALTQLVDKEAQLISCIERRRFGVIEDIKKLSIKSFLKKAASLSRIAV